MIDKFIKMDAEDKQVLVGLIAMHFAAFLFFSLFLDPEKVLIAVLAVFIAIVGFGIIAGAGPGPGDEDKEKKKNGGDR